MALQVSKAMTAIPAAEDYLSTCDVLIAEGNFRNGSYVRPEHLGLSIRVE